MLSQELRSLTRKELQSAIQDFNMESTYDPAASAKCALEWAKDYEFLDEIIKTLQSIGMAPHSTSEAIARIDGMRILAQALVSIAESRK